MTGILAEIVAYKHGFVRKCRERISLGEMERRALSSPVPRGFARALQGDGCTLIAEIKTASPSKGLIRDGIDVLDIAHIYEENGASCMSVLTDEQYFKGSLDRLTKISEVTTIPLLRKDFIIDPYQIYEARAAGADAILLIVACLGDDELRDFIEMASLLGLDCLVEVHDREEMRRAEKLNTPLIGINNRNLETFETRLSVTGELAPHVPDHALLVSESGISTADDVRAVHAMGASAVLVGEAIMRENDMAGKVSELVDAVK
ncbi:indole-3-glycerol phosphate synthase TrpC [Candidatus Latescibacterota bacterium]